MSKTILKATHEDRPIIIGEIEIPCAVLDNGQRVLSYRGVNRALAQSESWNIGAHKLPPFLSKISIKAFVQPDLAVPLSEPAE